MEQSDGETPNVSVACKVFTFEGSKKNAEQSLCVSIPEVLDPQYGMYVWPCAVVLAQYLWTRRDELRDKTVLELGAGVSLPGVVAGRCGAKVILSDNAGTPQCLENCRRSCEANGLRDVVVLGLTWGEISPDLALLPELDVILGSDVFYEPQGVLLQDTNIYILMQMTGQKCVDTPFGMKPIKPAGGLLAWIRTDFEDVLVTVAFLLRKSPRAQFWTTYQERSADWSIEALLRRWKLSCVDVQLERFDADKPALAGSATPAGIHSVQMMIITLETDDGGLEQTGRLDV